MTLVTESGASEPYPGELIAAIGHISAAEDAQFEHLLRSQLRRKFRVEVFSCRLDAVILVTLLHQVIDDHFSSIHGLPGLGYCIWAAGTCNLKAETWNLKLIPDTEERSVAAQEYMSF